MPWKHWNNFYLCAQYSVNTQKWVHGIELTETLHRFVQYSYKQGCMFMHDQTTVEKRHSKNYNTNTGIPRHSSSPPAAACRSLVSCYLFLSASAKSIMRACQLNWNLNLKTHFFNTDGWCTGNYIQRQLGSAPVACDKSTHCSDFVSNIRILS